MPAQPVIVGFVSQKGGTGKSTLARALGAVVAGAGLKVKIADLDPATADGAAVGEAARVKARTSRDHRRGLRYGR